MSAYELGYITGFAGAFLILSWLVLKAVKPSSLAGFNLTVGITALILIAGQFSQRSGTRLSGSLVAAGVAYLLLYRSNAKRFSRAGERITTLSLSEPLPDEQSTGAAAHRSSQATSQAEPGFGPGHAEPQAMSTVDAPAIDTPKQEITQAEERRSEHAASYSAVTSAGTQTSATESAPYPRTLAMLIAAIIILVTGAIRLLELGVFAVERGHWDAPGPSVVAIVLSIVCGIGLLRGSQRARKLMLVMAVLGVVASILAPLVESASITWIQGILQTMWMAGIVVLLAGQSVSIKRILAGVASVIIGWGGIYSLRLIEGINSVLSQTGVQKYAIADRAFSDSKLGVTVDLPSGWSLLVNPNPMVNVQDANALAFHGKSGCFAALYIEPVSDDVDPDDYLDALMELRQKDPDTLIETGRETAEMGGQPARRLYTEWTERNGRFKGFSTVSHDSFYYYQLTGWCAESAVSQSLPAFEQLEAGLRVTKSNQQRLNDMAAPLKLDMPYLSDKAARWLAESARLMGTEANEQHYAAYELLEEAIKDLPSRDRSQFNGILARAFFSLQPADYTRLKADQSKMLEEEPLDGQEIDWYQQIMAAACSRLDQRSRLLLQDLADRAVDKELQAASPEFRQFFQ